MLTSLDFIVLVFMAVGAMSLLGVALMFLLRNRIAQKICYYHVLAVTAYVGYIGMAIGQSLFPLQTGIGALVILGAVGGLVAELVAGRKNKKVFLILRIASAVLLAVGIINAIM